MKYESDSKIFENLVLRILLDNSKHMQLQQIYDEVKRNYPELTNDSILCPHDKKPNRPEWQHLVRFGLEHGKKFGIKNERGYWFIDKDEYKKR